MWTCFSSINGKYDVMFGLTNIRLYESIDFNDALQVIQLHRDGVEESWEVDFNEYDPEVEE